MADAHVVTNYKQKRFWQILYIILKFNKGIEQNHIFIQRHFEEWNKIGSRRYAADMQNGNGPLPLRAPALMDISPPIFQIWTRALKYLFCLAEWNQLHTHKQSIFNIFNIKINVACLNYSGCCNMSQIKYYSPTNRCITNPL